MNDNLNHVAEEGAGFVRWAKRKIGSLWDMTRDINDISGSSSSSCTTSARK